jgi:ankyrin repeat protein
MSSNDDHANNLAAALREAAASGDLARLMGPLRALVATHKDLINARDDKGQTALMKAAQSGSLDCVNALAMAGADLWADDKDGKGALKHALVSCHADCATYLMDMLQHSTPPE